ncbi:polyadenylate-binding protein-interacting protein 4-like isoform X2 [Impatiens glandulifera]|uniref:polyadenylate-binding protein-interacting protein 4-like isoform X2 n=1 Tax=Impatiens glandulifera TaxID=253017 RepID=UPI001FB0CA7C|nr:polyadenylate-binding protein-interacting protein 4-like isoform X2 [Impatiens glandulifera]
MGCRNRQFSGEETAASTSLSDALLFTTMCIIGFPVDVHVKDGSIYSGIFHTASVHNDYGVVLKQARVIKRGKCEANIKGEDLIETLVISPDDLVQVVAKGIMHLDRNDSGISRRDVMSTTNQPQSESCGRMIKGFAKDNVEKVESAQTQMQAGNEIKSCIMPTVIHVRDYSNIENGVENGEIKSMHFGKDEEASNTPHNMRQVSDVIPQGNELDCEGTVSSKEDASGLQGLYSSCTPVDACFTLSYAAKECQVNASELVQTIASSNCLPSSTNKADTELQERPTSGDTSCSNTTLNVSMSSPSSVDDNPGYCVTSSTAPRTNSPQKRLSLNTKEFKLNPGAKVFCPSFSNRRSVAPPAVPATTNMAYMPDNFPLIPVATSKPEVEFNSFTAHTPLPAKVISSGNLIQGNGIVDNQFSQMIVGQTGNRTMPLRYAGQYHTFQGLPSYSHPNYQNVMVGRFGQLVYMQPVSHDVNHQGVAAIPQVPTRPLLTTPAHSNHIPKHQGNVASQTFPLCVTTPLPPAPPLMSGGQQPFGLPNHHSLPQPPFHVFHSIPVPGSNGIYTTKFP